MSIENLLNSKNIQADQETIDRVERNIETISKEREIEKNYEKLAERKPGIPVSESLTYSDNLIVGLYRDGEWNKSVEIKKPDAFIKASFFEMKARKNPLEGVRLAIKKSVISIGNLSASNQKGAAWKRILDNLAMVDVDAILLFMAVSTKRTKANISHTCHNCDKEFEIEINAEDIDIFDLLEPPIVENGIPYIIFTNDDKQWSAKVKIPTLQDVMLIQQEDEADNPMMVTYCLWARCVKELNGEEIIKDGSELELFASLDEEFLDWFAEEWEANMPSVDKTIEAECVKCGEEVSTNFEPIFFLFQSQKKSQKHKKQKRKRRLVRRKK